MLSNTFETPLKRVAIFYDGTFFVRLSQYYRYFHAREAFLDIRGFHEYVRNRVAAFETGKNESLCQVVEAHYFRGRFSLAKAKAANAIETDRLQDQLLMYAGVVTHYFPMDENQTPPKERGIDVWLALEAYDMAVHKRFDVLVLVAGDQDYVPLIRKVNSLGTRVMVVGVDLTYTDTTGTPRYQKTSQILLDTASYKVIISEEVNSQTARKDRVIDGLFYRP
jgi:uncharacterized LabA/DUF88 family protein